MLLALTTILA